MSKRDYYEVLNVSKTATESELKTSYRRLAMKLHPDRNPDDETAQDKFKECKEAYEVLKDPQKRAAYDQYGHAGVGQGAGPGGFHGDVGDMFGDIFGDIFGGGRGRGRPQQQRGADLRYPIELDLEEAVRGIEREIRIPTLAECGVCTGSGSQDGSRETCSTCNGVGQVRMQQGIFSMQQTCPSCQGNGSQVSNPCSACHGQGRIREHRTLSVKIPAGVDNGDRIRLSGEGEAGQNSAPSGDLYVEVHVKAHEIFERDGDDLYCDAPIDFTMATLGGEFEVPTLDGQVKLKIPSGTQSGKMFRMRGKGVKSVRSQRHGDLLCRVRLETPVNLNKKQKQALHDFQESLGDQKHHYPDGNSWLDGLKSFFNRAQS